MHRLGVGVLCIAAVASCAEPMITAGDRFFDSLVILPPA
jgi:hypothetical protein